MVTKSGVKVLDFGLAKTQRDESLTGSRAIMGVMLESFINPGNQPLVADRSQLKYGVSVTDPCIDWPTTERCLLEAAEALAPLSHLHAAALER